RNIMKKRGVEKIPGCSSIEINGIVHEFVAKDVLHPQFEWIYECLVSLTKQLELLMLKCEIPAYGDEFVS
ncbi:hypothetical protein VIGAN_02016200, partial [Vigna angularis var. angularis]